VNRTATKGILFLCVLVMLSCAGYGVGVGPTIIQAEQRPGSQATFELTITNNTETTEELRLSVGDFVRRPDGEFDWNISVRSARWMFTDPIEAGGTLTVRYTVKLPLGAPLLVQGVFDATTRPQVQGSIIGPSEISGGNVGRSGSTSSEPKKEVWIARTLEAIDAALVATIRLDIHIGLPCQGMTIYEQFSQRVDITSLDTAGAVFDTVNRSSATWVTLSHSELVLEPGESQEVSARVAMPEWASGSYWNAIFVSSIPKPKPGEGAQIITVYRVAVQLYLTAMGTAQVMGQLVGVDVRETEPLTVVATFENTGHTFAMVSATVDIVDQTGTTVRSFSPGKSLVLPQNRYEITIEDEESETPLPAGIYQAIVQVDYGADTLVGGVRGFRVR
jgi:hypothetical protein